MLWIYSLAHFCVDFGCAFFIYSRFLNIWQWTLCLVLYNFCAFAMQAPLGLLCDRINKNAVMAAAGCVIVALSAFLAKYAVLACIVAGIGNAFFHLGGGIDTLNDCGDRCAKLGVFVSPGAFGIFFGTRLGKTRGLPYLYVVGALIFVGILILLAASRSGLLARSRNVPVSFTGIDTSGVIPAAICFFLVVCLRSLAGNSMAFPWKSAGQWGLILTCGVVFGKTAGERFRRFGVVNAGHIDEHKIFGRHYQRVKCGGHGGIYAAGRTDDDALHADGLEEQAHAVGQRAENLRCFRLVGNHNRISLRKRFKVENLCGFLIRFAGEAQDSMRVVGGVRSVKGIDGLAIVLDADVVHIEERRARFSGETGKDAAPLVVLAEGVRRRGDIDEKVRMSLFAKDFHRRKPIVVAPSVFAKQAADCVFPVVHGKAHGRNQVLRRDA